MPDLTASGLRQLGFDPRHLDFWTVGAAPQPSCGPGLDAIRQSLAMPKRVKVYFQRQSLAMREIVEATVPATLGALTRTVAQLLAQVSPPMVGVSLRFYQFKLIAEGFQFLGINDDCDVLAIERGDCLFALARPLVKKVGSQRQKQVRRRRRGDSQELRLAATGGSRPGVDAGQAPAMISGQCGLPRDDRRGWPARAQWRGQLRSSGDDRGMSDSRSGRRGRRGSWQRRAPMASREGGAKIQGRRQQS